jgi:hypothetical protein
MEKDSFISVIKKTLHQKDDENHQKRKRNQRKRFSKASSANQKQDTA